MSTIILGITYSEPISIIVIYTSYILVVSLVGKYAVFKRI